MRISAAVLLGSCSSNIVPVLPDKYGDLSWVCIYCVSLTLERVNFIVTERVLMDK